MYDIPSTPCKEHVLESSASVFYCAIFMKGYSKTPNLSA